MSYYSEHVMENDTAYDYLMDIIHGANDIITKALPNVNVKFNGINSSLDKAVAAINHAVKISEVFSPVHLVSLNFEDAIKVMNGSVKEAHQWEYKRPNRVWEMENLLSDLKIIYTKLKVDGAFDPDPLADEPQQ